MGKPMPALYTFQSQLKNEQSDRQAVSLLIAALSAKGTSTIQTLSKLIVDMKELTSD
jgi:UDP-N-acetylglucosamine enolpyruvyl transferase